MSAKLEICLGCDTEYPIEVFELFLDSATEQCAVLCMNCVLKAARAVIGEEYQFNTGSNIIKYNAILEYDKNRGINAGTNTKARRTD